MHSSSLATIARISERVASAMARPRHEAPLAAVVLDALDDLVSRAFDGVSREPPWWAERLGLDAVDVVLGWLAVAPAIAVVVGQSYGVLRANPDDWTLSEAVAGELLGASGPPASLELAARLGVGSRLVELGLLERKSSPSPLMASLVPSSAFLAAALSDGSQALGSRARLDPLIVAPSIEGPLAEVLATFAAADPLDPASCPALVIHGARRCGRRLVAAHAAARVGRELRSVSLDSNDTARALLVAAVLEAGLAGQMLHVSVGQGVQDEVLAGVMRHLDRFAPLWSLALTDARALPRLERPVLRLDLGFPGPAERRRLFQQYLPRRLQDASTLDVAAHRYRVAGGEIRDVCLELGDAGEAGLGLARMDAAVRAHVTHNLRARARLVSATESFSDLVVGDELQVLLRIIVANYRHRRLVLDDWGFGGRFGKGLGLSALFSGPPGTGKTMAAAAVAAELGLPLYQIELSQIVSKWVGETEKALDDVFREAEAASAALLFDEADSLFSKRTDVTSANDRYANLVVGYFLQRVEAFTGVVLLTTNNLGAIDTAFLRRFSYHVAFPLPSPAERSALWRSLIPSGAPLQGAINFEQLARDFEFSGGHIKNAVIRAAYFAAELQRPIDEALLRVTARLEVKQLGGIVKDLNLAALLGGRS